MKKGLLFNTQENKHYSPKTKPETTAGVPSNGLNEKQGSSIRDKTSDNIQMVGIVTTNHNHKRIEVKTIFDWKMMIYRIDVRLKRK